MSRPAESKVRIFGAPQRYIQGPGAMERVGEYAARFGKRPLVIADEFILGRIGSRLDAILQGSGLTPMVRSFGGEITYPAIDRLKTSLEEMPSVAIGVGGGKSLDAAKALARQMGLDVITVPTIASNDSPTSASIAMYDDHHVMISVDRLACSPQAVIVDTAFIARAPAHFLRAGIGDALSKKFEADACLAGTGITPFGTRPLMTSIAIADACYRTLRQTAEAALQAVERQEVNAELEATVEATILMSGLGFENGGLSVAHSLTRGLVKARDAKNAIHGAHVAWGLLVQLAAEGRDDAFLDDLSEFYRDTGLPIDLAGLGMKEATLEEIDEIAGWTMTAPHLANFATGLTQELIADAIRRIETRASVARTGTPHSG